jgi:hypothetical protein
MTHVNLDDQNEVIKQFVLGLAGDPSGSVLELNGRPVACVMPPPKSMNGDQEPSLQVPPGILRSQQAYWRDLPELLKDNRTRGKWVCYHGDERIGIGERTALIRETLRRGIPDDAYYIDGIQPQELPPWEDIEVEPVHPRVHEDIPPES